MKSPNFGVDLSKFDLAGVCVCVCVCVCVLLLFFGFLGGLCGVVFFKIIFL